MVLNLSTHSLTPQFNVVKNDNFVTVDSDGEENYEKLLHLLNLTSARMKYFLEDLNNVLKLAD